MMHDDKDKSYAKESMNKLNNANNTVDHEELMPNTPTSIVEDLSAAKYMPKKMQREWFSWMQANTSTFTNMAGINDANPDLVAEEAETDLGQQSTLSRSTKYKNLSTLRKQ